MEAGSQIYRRSWSSQAQALLIGVLFILLLGVKHRMVHHGHLTLWAYMQGLVIFAVVFAAMAFHLHRPTLKLDAEGVHLETLQYSWTYRWRDIQGVEEFQRHTPPIAACLGLKVRPGVAPQHRYGEAIWRAIYGYQAVIGDGWDVPLSQLRENIERYRMIGEAG